MKILAVSALLWSVLLSSQVWGQIPSGEGPRDLKLRTADVEEFLKTSAALDKADAGKDGDEARRLSPLVRKRGDALLNSALDGLRAADRKLYDRITRFTDERTLNNQQGISRNLLGVAAGRFHTHQLRLVWTTTEQKYEPRYLSLSLDRKELAACDAGISRGLAKGADGDDIGEMRRAGLVMAASLANQLTDYGVNPRANYNVNVSLVRAGSNSIPNMTVYYPTNAGRDRVRIFVYFIKDRSGDLEGFTFAVDRVPLP